MADNNQVTYIGTTDYRNQQVKFGIKAIDRSRHMYIIGKTGMGKSTVLENLAVQDIANGEGVVFIDPHGSAIEKLLDYVPEHRINDVIYFAPFDTDFPISFNVMEDIDPDKRHLVVNGLMASFKKIWQDAWSARMEYILTNTLLALMETPNSTLLGVNRMYADKAYRDMIIANVTDNAVKAFWLDEFNKWDVKFMREATAAIQNKIGQFTGNPLIRNIIGQSQSSFDFRKAMDERKIILMNLSKGLIGEENMRLLGGMLITKLYLAAMSRADVGAYLLDTLPSCYFFVDEFQNFANESFADILAEARKYKLSLTVANQYIAQMEEVVRDAVFGNVGTTISFRVGPFDAEVLERAFMPAFTQEDMVNIAKFQMYLTLSIDAVGSKPFSANGLPPIPRPEISFKDQVIAASRAQYAKSRAGVEQVIMEWFTPVAGSVASTPDGKEKKPYGASAVFNPNYAADKKLDASASTAVATAKPADNSTPRIVPSPGIVQSAPVKKNDAPQQTAFKKPAFVPAKVSQPAMSSTLQSLIDQIDAPVDASKNTVSVAAEKPTVNPVPVAASSRISEVVRPREQIQSGVSPEVASKPQPPVAPKKQEFSRAANDDNKQALRDLLKRVNTTSTPVTPQADPIKSVPIAAALETKATDPIEQKQAVSDIQQSAPIKEKPTVYNMPVTPTIVITPTPQIETAIAEPEIPSYEPILSSPVPTQTDSAAPPIADTAESEGFSGRIYSPGQPKEIPEDILRKVLE